MAMRREGRPKRKSISLIMVLFSQLLFEAGQGSALEAASKRNYVQEDIAETAASLLVWK